VVKEMNKVTWPKKDELRGTTVMFLIVCLVVAVFVWGVDTLISALLNLFYNTGR
jgi:preprotein translocase SecE subunit